MEPSDESKLLLPASRKPSGWGTRHTMIIMAFWGFAFSYAMRFNLSMAIVAMVNRTVPANNSTNSSVRSSCPSDGVHLQSSWLTDALNADDPDPDPQPSGEFDWDEAEQGLILGSFFYGYVLTQLPGGMLAGKFGGKWPLGLGLLLAGIFAILTPIMARAHTALLVTARIIQGLGEGVTTPAMHALLSAWAPPDERGMMATVAYAGTSFGTAATMVVSGYLIHGNVMGGWPSVFYIIGIASCCWFVLWCFLVYGSPADHPRISAEELLYIQNTIGEQKSKVKLRTPWGKIFKSLPFWAILVSHVGHTWGGYTLLTELPTYMKSVLNFDIKQNSWMSALPYIAMWATAIVLIQLADYFVAKKWIPVVWVRKMMQICAHMLAGICLIGVAYSGCDRVVTVALLTVSVGLNGASFGGFGVNHVDIAANHASVLMGITNTFSNMCGFVAPWVAGMIINNNPSIERWRIVFFIAAAVYIADTIFYLIFGSATEQPWNRETEVIEPDPMNGPSAVVSTPINSDAASPPSNGTPTTDL